MPGLTRQSGFSFLNRPPRQKRQVIPHYLPTDGIKQSCNHNILCYYKLCSFSSHGIPPSFALKDCTSLANNPSSAQHRGMRPTMTVPDNLPNILRELCHSQALAVLATAAGSAPYANLVAVAFAIDLRHFFFATPRSTRKWHNLSSNPQISLLIDNRSNQVADFKRAAAATILGTARELSKADREEGQKLYLAKHPHLSEFLAGPDCALFQVKIEQIYLVTHFQEVMQFDFTA